MDQRACLGALARALARRRRWRDPGASAPQVVLCRDALSPGLVSSHLRSGKSGRSSRPRRDFRSCFTHWLKALLREAPQDAAWMNRKHWGGVLSGNDLDLVSVAGRSRIVTVMKDFDAAHRSMHTMSRRLKYRIDFAQWRALYARLPDRRNPQHTGLGRTERFRHRDRPCSGRGALCHLRQAEEPDGSRDREGAHLAAARSGRLDRHVGAAEPFGQGARRCA